MHIISNLRDRTEEWYYLSIEMNGAWNVKRLYIWGQMLQVIY